MIICQQYSGNDNPNLKRHQDYDFLVRFSDKYTLKPSSLLTVNVNWQSGVRVTSEDFRASYAFIEKYKKRINPRTYHTYNKTMFYKAKEQQADQDVLDHYKREAVANKKYLSLVDFMEWTYEE